MASEKRIGLGIVLLAAIQAVRHSGCALVRSGSGTQETTGWMWRMGQLATSNLTLTDKCWTAVVTLVDALVPPS
jgi:hypothetical protein